MNIEIGTTFKSKTFDNIICTILDINQKDIVIHRFSKIKYNDDGTEEKEIYNKKNILDQYKNGLYTSTLSKEVLLAGLESGYYYLIKA